MGSNLLIIVATLSFQTPQQDSTATSITHGFGFERPSDLFQHNRVQGLSLGRTVSNTFNSLLAGHDNGDYRTQRHRAGESRRGHSLT